MTRFLSTLVVIIFSYLLISWNLLQSIAADAEIQCSSLSYDAMEMLSGKKREEKIMRKLLRLFSGIDLLEEISIFYLFSNLL